MLHGTGGFTGYFDGGSAGELTGPGLQSAAERQFTGAKRGPLEQRTRRFTPVFVSFSSANKSLHVHVNIQGCILPITVAKLKLRYKYEEYGVKM